MKRNRSSLPPLSLPFLRASGSVEEGTSSASANAGFSPLEKRGVESGLLGLCHEIAGLLLRRYLEKRDPLAVHREVRGRLVAMMKCSEERAGQLIDLSLELIHVKTHGSFKRNHLELSILIARAGNQLREVGDN